MMKKLFKIVGVPIIGFFVGRAIWRYANKLEKRNEL